MHLALYIICSLRVEPSRPGPRRAAALLEENAAFCAAYLSVRSFLLPRRRRASTGLRRRWSVMWLCWCWYAVSRRWSVMEPAALLVLVCCQPQPPASLSSSLSKLLPSSWQWIRPPRAPGLHPHGEPTPCSSHTAAAAVAGHPPASPAVAGRPGGSRAATATHITCLL